MNGIIYGLVGPDGLRYIGQTRRPLMKRWRCHRYDADRMRDLHVYRWWRSLTTPPKLTENARRASGRLT